MDPKSLSWLSSFSSTPTTRSTIVLNEKLSSAPKLRRFFVQASKRCTKPVSSGLQKDPKKDLSRILRTEAAIRGVENKANSKKYKQLWPKAVLEALDEAIKEIRWEAALKVCPSLSFSCYCNFFGDTIGLLHGSTICWSLILLLLILFSFNRK